MRELFEEMDEDGSGEVDYEELRNAFARLGADLTQDDVRDYVAEYDKDGSGVIDFDEFLLMVEGILLEAKNHLTRGHDNIPSVEHTKYFMQSRLFQEVSDGLLDRPRDEALARTVAVLWGFDPARRGEDQLLADPSAYVDAMDAVRAAVSKPTEALGEDLALPQPEWLKHTPIWQARAAMAQTKL